MRFAPACALLAGTIACGASTSRTGGDAQGRRNVPLHEEASAPAPPVPRAPARSPDPLAGCVAAARVSADVTAAMEACELEHVGVAWRAASASKPSPRLEPRLVKAGARALHGRMRVCFENGLRNCPN